HQEASSLAEDLLQKRFAGEIHCQGMNILPQQFGQLQQNFLYPGANEIRIPAIEQNGYVHIASRDGLAGSLRPEEIDGRNARGIHLKIIRYRFLKMHFPVFPKCFACINPIELPATSQPEIKKRSLTEPAEATENYRFGLIS
ncbi:MAG TPA: hypothetical protein VMU60_04575, partial [Syntrophobacteria bacterium]|nr:hypothetical protein [Syntrophobacteria bacterium]